jgi:hypothetical protein
MLWSSSDPWVGDVKGVFMFLHNLHIFEISNGDLNSIWWGVDEEGIILRWVKLMCLNGLQVNFKNFLHLTKLWRMFWFVKTHQIFYVKLNIYVSNVPRYVANEPIFQVNYHFCFVLNANLAKLFPIVDFLVQEVTHH